MYLFIFMLMHTKFPIATKNKFLKAYWQSKTVGSLDGCGLRFFESLVLDVAKRKSVRTISVTVKYT